MNDGRDYDRAILAHRRNPTPRRYETMLREQERYYADLLAEAETDDEAVQTARVGSR